MKTLSRSLPTFASHSTLLRWLSTLRSPGRSAEEEPFLGDLGNIEIMSDVFQKNSGETQIFSFHTLKQCPMFSSKIEWEKLIFICKTWNSASGEDSNLWSKQMTNECHTLKWAWNGHFYLIIIIINSYIHFNRPFTQRLINLEKWF